MHVLYGTPDEQQTIQIEYIQTRTMMIIEPDLPYAPVRDATRLESLNERREDLLALSVG